MLAEVESLGEQDVRDQMEHNKSQGSHKKQSDVIALVFNLLNGSLVSLGRSIFLSSLDQSSDEDAIAQCQNGERQSEGADKHVDVEGLAVAVSDAD